VNREGYICGYGLCELSWHSHGRESHKTFGYDVCALAEILSSYIIPNKIYAYYRCANLLGNTTKHNTTQHNTEQ